MVRNPRIVPSSDPPIQPERLIKGPISTRESIASLVAPANIPKNHIIGLSKLARLVEVFARRVQVQERLTTQIATTLMEELDALGVGVVLKAEHLCMRMRGVEKQNSVVVTSAMLGTFRTHQATRQEFMTLMQNGKA